MFVVDGIVLVSCCVGCCVVCRVGLPLIIVPGVCGLQLALLQGYFTLRPLGAPLSKKQQVLKGIGSSLLRASGVS